MSESLSALSDAVTVLAAIVGGCWAYYLFVRSRQRHPRLEIAIRSDVVRVSKSTRLIEVVLNLKNSGGVLLRPEYGEIRARVVVPLPETLHSIVEKGFDPLAQAEAIVTWPVLAQRHWNWAAGALELEPGESEGVVADFFVPDTISVIQLYVFIRNPTKGSGVGWTSTEVLHLGEVIKDTGYSHPRVKENGEQRQQVPLPPQQSTQQSPTQNSDPKQGGTSTGGEAQKSS